MKAKGYITIVRAQVKADNNNDVPKHLELTIRNYAAALEMRDVYKDQVMKDPTITEVGSMGQTVTRQHPLCSLLYQQEVLCQGYAKMLGLTSAKAAVKTEAPEKLDPNDQMKGFYEAAKKQ